MSAIQSFSAAYGHLRPELGNYERNSRAFGPAVATALGAADVAVEAASSTYQFSQQALEQLYSAGRGGVEAVTGAVSTVAHDTADAVTSVIQGIASLPDDAVALARQGLGSIQHAAGAVADTVSDLAEDVGDTVGAAGHAVGDAVGGTVNRLAGYAALGASVLGGAIDDLL
jgi:phage-related protein